MPEESPETTLRVHALDSVVKEPCCKTPGAYRYPRRLRSTSTRYCCSPGFPCSRSPGKPLGALPSTSCRGRGWA
jgi:hypothetical protein